MTPTVILGAGWPGPEEARLDQLDPVQAKIDLAALGLSLARAALDAGLEDLAESLTDTVRELEAEIRGAT
jgi:hypothetical protein